MKKSLVITLSLFIIFSGEVMCQIKWMKQAGDPTNGDIGFSLDFDSQSNIYISGRYSGNAIFSEDVKIEGDNKYNGFLAKYDKDGNFVWVRNIPGRWDSAGDAVVVDSEDNIIVTGGGGAGLPKMILGKEVYFRKTSSEGVFVAKYSPEGTLLWHKLYYDKRFTWSEAITVDQEDNIIFSGRFEEINFEDDTLKSNGGVDIFLTKINRDGLLLWTKSFGGLEDDSPSTVLCDNQNNIILAGGINNTVIIDNDTLSVNEYNDVFISKFNVSGELMWVKSFGGERYDRVWDMTIDKFNDIYLTGDYIDTIIIEGKEVLPEAASHTNTYLVKFSSTSELLWFKKFQSQGNNWGQSITSSKRQNIYLTGVFSKRIKIGKETLNNNSSDLTGYVAKLNKAGKVKKVYKIPGEGSADFIDIAFSESDKSLVGIGSFSKKIHVSNKQFLETKSESDILLMKLNAKLKKD